MATAPGEVGSTLLDRHGTLVRSWANISVRDLRATVPFYALASGWALQDIACDEAEAAATVTLQRGRLAVRWFQKGQGLVEDGHLAEPVPGCSLQVEAEDTWCVVDRAVGAGAVLGDEYETSHRRVACMPDLDGVAVEVCCPKRVRSERKEQVDG